MSTRAEKPVRRSLVLMRHGKSDWTRDVADLARPIGGRGRRQAAEAGAWLARHASPVDVAVVSPAERARTTWALAAGELSVPPRVRTDERIYAGSTEDLVAVVRGLDSEVCSAVLVGHEPRLTELLSRLSGETREMPTSCLAVLETEGEWSRAGVEAFRLCSFGRPPPAPLRPRSSGPDGTRAPRPGEADRDRPR